MPPRKASVEELQNLKENLNSSVQQAFQLQLCSIAGDGEGTSKEDREASIRRDNGLNALLEEMTDKIALVRLTRCLKNLETTMVELDEWEELRLWTSETSLRDGS